ncbi:PQQ-binding-like beta-propeller repeat protein [Alteraurantiacibacter aquimixticola]|uniref:Pyrroloquinoline quinone-dependent dehydrogenase n=1 Tax=Alteraurantiacibacter aquimixticola TaxID=2489173 RepID=A0A4V6UGC2_9SPHN|nr:PQQ-binding-like beta-propeller repeat protein [Alteraurantiacibacter aquimixticola]TIX51567.1 pyrroloquinoline quinone-dependent dehydrogenase [Alteraurantiacibacter aquimixticola]
MVVINLSNISAGTRAMGRRGMKLAAISALAMASAACSTAYDSGMTTTAAAPSSAIDYVGWDGYLGGGDSSQYSALDQINRSNVSQLEVAWTYATGEGQPPIFSPTVGGGRMYVQNGQGQIVALDPATGSELWVSSLEGRGAGSRGVNYWESEDGSEGRLIVLNGGMLRAIDAATGQVITSFGNNGGVDLRDALADDVAMPGNPLMTNNPGRIYKNTVIMSLPAGAYDYASSPADVQAYDVITGELKWVFHSVPREGEFGYDTWPAEDHEKFGGVHNWSESTIDVENGIMFVPFGTARYDFYGGNREGDNLFANSLVAINAETGERIWHFQIVHHDLWDFDLPVAPKLMTITKDGQDIPIVIQATKHGYVFAFNRLTGEPIWPIEEVAVPASDVEGEHASPTQPVPTWPEPFMRLSFTEDDINPYLPEADQEALRNSLRNEWRNDGIFTPPSERGSISHPGHNGGANWGNVAVDPVNQRLYVVSRELPLLLKINKDNRESALAAMPNAQEDNVPWRWPVNFMLQSNGMVAIKPPFSNLTAYDMNTGERIFHIPNGEILTLEEQGITGVGAQAPRSGPIATAGGLLFVNTASDRAFRARDAATGEVLWEHRFDAATEGVPAVYEVNGRQYITVPVGGVGHFLGGLGLPEPGESRYVTFALPAGN